MENFYKEALKKFFDHWGFDAQSMICIEEMSELTKALCKYKRYGKEKAPEDVKQNVLEEIADVLNITEGLKIYFGEEEIEKIRKQKVERTLKRLEWSYKKDKTGYKRCLFKKLLERCFKINRGIKDEKTRLFKRVWANCRQHKIY